MSKQTHRCFVVFYTVDVHVSSLPKPSPFTPVDSFFLVFGVTWSQEDQVKINFVVIWMLSDCILFTLL